MHTLQNGPFGSDITLIGQICHGDSVALEQLYATHASVVFSVAHRILRDPQLTEEVVQDVFLQAWRDAASYDAARAPVRAWLLVMTRARALDRLRSRRAREIRVAEFQRSAAPRFHPTPDYQLDSLNRDQQAEVEAVLDVLPFDDRGLMSLAFVDGLSHSEIADRLGQPLGTVKTRLRRVLHLIRAATGGMVARPFNWRPQPRLAPRPPGRALTGVTVSVVDDDADTLRLLTLVLQHSGATVMAAATAALAFKRVVLSPPDVLVTDIDMPDEDGYGLLARVRDLGDVRMSRLPAIAFTAHGTAAESRRALGAGFAVHLPKPISPAVLVGHVAALVGPATPQGQLQCG